jgi:hypothetical protein
MPFLFEFMDQAWVPASLHATLRDVLGFHLRVTLGYYYRWAADRAYEVARTAHLDSVTEVGAGAAGFSERLATLVVAEHAPLRVEVSDLRPDVGRYRQLEHDFPGVLRAHLDPVDLLRWTTAPGATLVVMSAAFHHVPLALRPRVLLALAGHRVLIFESVTRTVPSMLGCAIGFLPALLTPLYFAGLASGRWRRVIWCWLIPVAPVMVAWDGVVSCLRCWTEEEWRGKLRDAGVPEQAVRIERRRFSHMIGW